MVRLQRGFSLIELMLVVVIVGALAAIAIPNFLRMQCRTKQTEVRIITKAMATAERAYGHEYDEYVPTGPFLRSLVGMAPFNSRYYTYVTTVTPGAFVINPVDALRRINPPALDLWTMTELDMEPIHISDACMQ